MTAEFGLVWQKAEVRPISISLSRQHSSVNWLLPGSTSTSLLIEIFKLGLHIQ